MLKINLVSLIAEQNIVPDVSVKPVLSNDSAKKSCIPVQLVLDIGNSRTCGVLIEDNKLENKDFLGLRNLNNPIHIYKEPFPSCIEIAKTSMVDLPVNENIFDVHVFAWTSMVRTGFEAEALASGKIGNEGNTGLSSPKRYLWDNDSAATEWRRNCTMDRTKYMGPSSSNTADWCNNVPFRRQSMSMSLHVFKPVLRWEDYSPPYPPPYLPTSTA